MTETSNKLSLEVQRQPGSSNAIVVVKLPQDIVQKFYSHALVHHRHHFTPYGLQRQETPLTYVDAQYKTHLVKHLSEFLLKFVVISFLYRQLRTLKLVIVGDPVLQSISVNPDDESYYRFEVTLAPSILVHDWKYLPFKAPKRRLYKDIDKQASNFLEEENSSHQINREQREVQVGDWIQFSVQLTAQNDEVFMPDLKEQLWLQIGEEETSIPFRELFVGKKLGEPFVTNAQCIQEYFTSLIDSSYRFLITINKILPKAFFDIEHFKEHFKLKTDKKVHQKIVEVYSSKHDLSLRRSMVEEAMRVLNQAYPIDAPQNTVQDQEQLILKNVQNNPDYAVYKQQKDFLSMVKNLAEKQVKEVIIIDHFAYQESVPLADDEVAFYLNFTKRARTKEFLHFIHPMIRINEEEIPIPHESLKQVCLREKTLNHILYHLNK